MGRPGIFSDQTSNESGKVDLFLQWTSGAAGAVASIQRQSGFGIAAGLGLAAVVSIVVTGTGLYTVQFDQAWASKFLDYNFTPQQATYAAGGACESNILTDNLMATTGVMTINITNQAGALVAPTTGDVLIHHWTMQSHTAGY